jgi:hypothetical protein
MKTDRAMFIALLAALAAAKPALAEGFRCGQRIATPDMSVAELLDACGEPASKSIEVVDVSGPNAQGAGNIKRGTVTVETWTYDRGSQASAMVVTIEDGRIRKMERAE